MKPPGRGASRADRAQAHEQKQTDDGRLVADVGITVGPFTLDVCLTVAVGEVVVVLGPNGAGKTTLLRALAGLTPITSGRITLADDILDDPGTDTFVPAQRRPVGVVFQDYLLFTHLSARDNIAFGLQARHHASRRQARAQADNWLQRFDLTSHGDRRPGQLSGGQAQRVALARALAPAPRLMLLDEPLAALDATTRADIRAHLTATLAGSAAPVLLVTHDPLDAMTLADRIVILENGRIVQDATPAEVARRPRTPYAARLVGLNLYPGTAADGVVTLRTGGFLHIPDVAPAGAAGPAVPAGPAGPVLVAIRPSAVALHTREPHGSPRNVLSGPVASLEPFGDRVRVTVASTPTIHADITTAALAELHLSPGTPVWATIKATDLDIYPG
ncbi:MAG: ABC transporter ATP-binding protein [Frankia sp.]